MNRPDHSFVLGRRTLLRVGAAAGAASLFPVAMSAAPTPATIRRTRAYVIVGAGSTVTDHVMMLTGVLPDRHGIPAGVTYDRREERVRKLDQPRDLHYPTILDRLQDKGLATGSAVADTYPSGTHLSGVLGDRATHRFPTIRGLGTDRGAMDAALSMVTRSDPDLLFVSLGDVREPATSRPGKAQGPALPEAIAGAVTEVGRLVDLLQSTGRWHESVLIVAASHTPGAIGHVELDGLSTRLDADPLLAGRVKVVPNAASVLLYWTGPPHSRREAVRRIRGLAVDAPGVVSVHQPSELGLGARAGDVIAWCGPDPRFTAHALHSGRVTLVVTGGSPLVRNRTASSTVSRCVDVAPTVGRIFGLTEPRGGYDGTSLL